MPAGRRGNNEGTISKREDGRWMARISLGDGKRKAVYGKTRADVARQLAELIRDRDKGLPIVTEQQTLAQYLQSWLEVKRPPRLAQSTWISYRDFVQVHITPTLG